MIQYTTDPSKLMNAGQPSMLGLAQGVVDEVSTSIPMNEGRMDRLKRIKAKMKMAARDGSDDGVSDSTAVEVSTGGSGMFLTYGGHISIKGRSVAVDSEA
jgi:hypothetical protein